MHRTISSLAVLILAGSLAAQGRPVTPDTSREFEFPGKVVLQIGADSMTDHKTCKVSITSDELWIDTAGVHAVVIVTGADVDYSRPAYLRIGNSPAFPLIVPQQRRRLLVPPARAAFVVHALYAQQRLRLRFSEWPGGLFDEEIKFGDFASAYDRGVQLCGWHELPVTAVHPSAETVTALDPPELPSPEVVAEGKQERKAKWIEESARALARNWLSLRPDSVQTENGKFKISFHVARDGSVAGAVGPAGWERDDVGRACMNAVRVSSPFQVLPAGQSSGMFVLECDALTGVKLLPLSFN